MNLMTVLTGYVVCNCCVRMDDDRYVMKYTEMVLRQNFGHCDDEDFANIKQEPDDGTSDVQSKVCHWYTDRLLLLDVFLNLCLVSEITTAQISAYV